MTGLYILVAHLLGDFVFQSDWMAANKRKNTYACLQHCVVYAVVFDMVTWFCLPGWVPLLVFLTHFPVDRWGLARKLMTFLGSERFATGPLAPWSVVAVDQVMHLATLALLGGVGVYFQEPVTTGVAVFHLGLTPPDLLLIVLLCRHGRLDPVKPATPGIIPAIQMIATSVGFFLGCPEVGGRLFLPVLPDLDDLRSLSTRLLAMAAARGLTAGHVDALLSDLESRYEDWVLHAAAPDELDVASKEHHVMPPAVKL